MPGGHSRRDAARHDAALREAKARHRAAGQKVSRMKRQGIVTGGIDPRRPASELAGMSTRELRAYTRQVNRFVSRSTQYVGLKGGVPVPKAKWDRYKRLQTTYNARTDTFDSNINDIKIAPVGMTVGQRRKRMEPDDPIRAGAARRTFERIERKPSGINGSAALEKLTKDMQRRTSPKYLDREVTAMREQIRTMVNTIGDAGLRQKIFGYTKNELKALSAEERAQLTEQEVNGLSNAQLIVLVDGSEFMAKLGHIYTHAKSVDTDKPDWQTKATEDTAALVHEYVDWAGTLSPKLDENVTRSDDTSPRTRGSRRK